MKLTVKVFLFFFIFIVLWSAIMAILLPHSVLKGFETLEDARFTWEIDRVQIGFESLVNTHRSVLLDWTKWDEAYRFVKNKDISFIDENITTNFFVDQNINYVFLYDENDNLILESGYDYKSEKAIDVPKKLASTIVNQKNRSGLIYLDEKIYIFSAYQVTDSDAEAPLLGLFAFVFILTDDNINLLGDTLQEYISILNPNESGKLEKIEINITKEKKSSIAVYNIPYVNKDSHLQLKLILPHDITILGRETVYETLLLFIGTFIILSVVLYFWVRKLVYSIYKLTSDVKLVHASKDLSKRVHVSSTGELGILRDSINDMLDQISNMHNKLTDYATLDLLTGILNRRGGFERLELLMKDSKERKTPLTICFIDINDLKHVNDTYGHTEGDDYLKSVSSTIQDNIRDADIFCRLGGDEFLIVFSHCNKECALNTVKRIQQGLDDLNETCNLPYEMSISIGLESYNHSDSIIKFIESADIKMYQNKLIFRTNKIKTKD